jgi:hypothetical protein
MKAFSLTVAFLSLNLKKITFCFFVVSLYHISFANADTYAVKVKEYGIADLTVKFKEYGIADETWKIKGSCRGVGSYTSIKIKEYGIADITVKVKSYGLADKDVCIKNPSDIPEWLMEMLD